MVTFFLSGAWALFHLSINPKSPIPAAASVLIGPAEIALTLIPSRPRSSARYFVVISNAALATPIRL